MTPETAPQVVEAGADVLVATSIVESGLDIPTANTMVVWRADMFGLAQLHQIRGRIGRSKARAFAYLTTDPKKPMTLSAERRLQVLQSLVDKGNSVITIEHNLDVVKCADHVIDLGPEGGSGGGTIVATGTPEQVARVAESHTGRFLAELLG